MFGLYAATFLAYFAAFHHGCSCAPQEPRLENNTFKAWGPEISAATQYSTYSTAVVTVYVGDQQIKSTEISEGHYPGITIKVEAYDRIFVLKMLLNRYLFSSTYVEKSVSAAGETYRKVNLTHDHCYYTGTVAGQSQSTAAVSTCYGVLGYFMYDHETYNIEPLDGTLIGSHRVYKNSDSVLPEYECGEKGHRAEDMHSGAKRKPTPTRIKRSFNWPQDAKGETKIVELYVVNDYTQYVSMDSNEATVNTRTKNIVNIASSLYQGEDIYLVLVGVEIWTDVSRITVNESDIAATGKAFNEYRKNNINPRYPNDNAQLITGPIVYETGYIGYAYTPAMCSYDWSSGINSDTEVMPTTAGVLLAHEMGHNFGMNHYDSLDGPCTCNNPNGYPHCIMYGKGVTARQGTWTDCSIQQLATSFDYGLGYCLHNVPETLFDQTPYCGNGIVEAGEQCDCGNAPASRCNAACCNSATCRLVAPARCSAGRCCDVATCQLYPRTTVCRSATGSCDLAENCDGVNAVCPPDAYIQDGTACTVDGVSAFCYEGRCQSHKSQCQLWWGPGIDASPDVCYTSVNIYGQIWGHCGYDRTKTVYKACAESDARCGLLHCNMNISTWKQVTDRLQIFPEWTWFVELYRATRSTDYCTTADSRLYYLGDRLPRGLVPNGAACGTDMMCLDQKCVAVSSLTTTTTTTTTTVPTTTTKRVVPKRCSWKYKFRSKNRALCRGWLWTKRTRRRYKKRINRLIMRKVQRRRRRRQ